VVVPPSEPLSSKLPDASWDDLAKRRTAFHPASSEEFRLLNSLKGLISSGDRSLEFVLASIADVARRSTGASGSAIAMWKDGAMVCRARSGETAPPLGTQLNAETGISGECLRTGVAQYCPDTENNAQVDLEVCRSLGLRSLAVLPIRGFRGINGILEVFSTVPTRFTKDQVALLEELTVLAERARSWRPHGAREHADHSPVEKPSRSRLLPASDRIRDIARAAVGGRSSRFVLGAIGVAAVLLVVIAVWLGWRGPEQSGANRNGAGSPSTVAAATARASHLPDNDPVWKPNPGGETLFLSMGKPISGYPITFASKTEVIKGKPAQASQLPSNVSPVDANPIIVLPAQQAASSDAATQADLPGTAQSEEPASAEAPQITAELTASSPLNNVLSGTAAEPALSFPVSQGVSGGRLLLQVSPVYPSNARIKRLEGKVVLTAMVLEDGSTSDVKVEQGAPELASSAVEAVKQWRYEPFALDGKPVKTETRITIDFKLP